MSYQAIVIGAGLSGAVMAERMASQLGWKVLVLEQRDHIGGNCFDEYDEHGVLIHRYGPHLFHTDKQEVWDYLSQFTEWLPYEHRVLSRIDGQLVPIPFNLTSIERCFPAEKAAAMIEALQARFGEGARVPIMALRQEAEPLLAELAQFIYERAFVNYTSKQWGVSAEQVSPEVTARVPVVVNRDDRYFIDPWQAVPEQGYTAMFERMLAHPLIEVRLSTPMGSHVCLDWQQKRILLDGVPFAGPLIYTGMLDQLMPEDHYDLPYRSLRFEHCHLPQAQFQPVTTVNYPNEEAYTRITEFKHLTGQQHPGTSIVYEYPCAYAPGQGLEPYYPLFTDMAKQNYQACRDELAQFPQLIALGRLAEYRYFDMDDAVDNALKKFQEFRSVQKGTVVSETGRSTGTPVISALMSTYNSADYIRATIDSILTQSLQEFEIVIVDDGSTDNTVDIIKSYHDPRIRLFIRSHNRGVGYSLSQALEYILAPVLIKVDSDDLSHPQRFEKQLKFLNDNPDIGLVKCYFEYFSDDSGILDSERFKARVHDAESINSINTEQLISENIPRWLCIEHTTYCARTSAVRASGYQDQRLCEDYSLFYRMHQHGCRMACIPEVLVKMRLSNNSLTALLDAEKRQQWFGYLVTMKLPIIRMLTGPSRQLAIYGTGGLACSMYHLLTDAEFIVSNFIEQAAKPNMIVGGVNIEVKALEDCLEQKIIIAAQPVRLKIMQQLLTVGLVEWRDFMVIA